MGWMSGTTALFGLAIVGVLTSGWLLARGVICASWEKPYPNRTQPLDVPGVECERLDTESGQVIDDPDTIPLHPHREHAHGRHEAQDR